MFIQNNFWDFLLVLIDFNYFARINREFILINNNTRTQCYILENKNIETING